jgi:hypothetical protein
MGAGFQISRTCPCVLKQTYKEMYVLVYVDYLLEIGRHEKEIADANNILSNLCQEKYMDVARYFLGEGVRRGAVGSIDIT